MAGGMSCGERVVRCLLGEPVDRVPYGVGIGWQPWGETLKRWEAETGWLGMDVPAICWFDRSFALPAVHLGIYPPFERVVLREDDDFAVVRDERGITRRDRRDRASMPEFIDHPVKTPADWERLKEERLRIDEPGRVEEDWDRFRSRLRSTGEAVQVGAFPFGVFGTPRDLLGVEELLVGFYSQPDLIRDMMSHLTTLWISLWQRVAEEVRIDHIHIWEDMSGRQGSLISPRMVEEFMMPCYDRIADFARSAGVRIISVDTDGDCSELVPVMISHGVNTFFPFEVQAGNDIRTYRSCYPELGIIGGMDKRALSGSRKDIDSEIERAEEMIRHGRYIPGFDHLIPPNVPWENYRYAAERIRAVCRNSSARR